MTLSEKYIIFQELIGVDFSWQGKYFEYNGIKYQLMKVDSESDGVEVFVEYQEVGKRQIFTTSLRIYSMETHRTRYNQELINAILKGLGRAYVREVKECSDYFN